MSLIECPDCKKQVSDQAPACPHCGRPIAATPAQGNNVQTIEATGKVWKGIQLIGALMICYGVISCVYNAYDPTPHEPSFMPTILFIGGFFVIVFGKFGAWWHHE